MIAMLTKSVNHAHDIIDSKSQELASKERIATQKNQTDILTTEIKVGNDSNVKVFQAELAHREAVLDMQQPVVPQETPDNSAPNAPQPQAQPLTPPQASPTLPA